MLVKPLLMPFIIRACSIHAYNPIRRQAYLMSKKCNDYNDNDSIFESSDNSKFFKQDKKAERLKTRRMMKQFVNKMSRKDIDCYYCDSTGYVDCYYCEEGCWRCQNTTMTECPFCGGTGKGRFAKSKIPTL